MVAYQRYFKINEQNIVTVLHDEIKKREAVINSIKQLAIDNKTDALAYSDKIRYGIAFDNLKYKNVNDIDLVNWKFYMDDRSEYSFVATPRKSNKTYLKFLDDNYQLEFSYDIMTKLLFGNNITEYSFTFFENEFYFSYDCDVELHLTENVIEITASEFIASITVDIN